MNYIRSAILDAKKRLEEIKPTLFKIYQEDYLQGDTKELEKRWNNTIFITEVTPEEEKIFIERYGKEGYSVKRRLQLEADYLDYKMIKKSLQRKIEEEFGRYIKDHYHVPEDCKNRNIWNLDFASYAYGCENHTRQKNYAYACLDMSMDVITDEEDIDDIERKRYELLERRNIELIKQTRWGKKMQERYPEIPADLLANILYDTDTSSATSLVMCEDHKLRTVCFLPLMRYTHLPSLDRMVLHELRHVIETTEEKSGLSVFKMPKYDMINELRTERNAKKDALKMPILFGRHNENGIQSEYDILLPATQELADREEEMNLVAFQENKELIDEYLGEDLDTLQEKVLREQAVLQKIRKG